MTVSTPIQTEIMDFDSVKLVGNDSNPEITLISPDDGFFLNDKFTSDFRIRQSIYDMMKQAQKNLPENYTFMIYEAYRPLSRQIELWKIVAKKAEEEYPQATEKEIRDILETYVADPYNGIGSGHQACCAIDVSLCDTKGKEYEMGTSCQEFTPLTRTHVDGLSPEAQKNRTILLEALEGVGLINYPAEWWHFSYGDHYWAHLVGKTEAFFGPLDL